MGYRYNVSCSETNAQNWTQSAVDCFSIGCSCSRCFLYSVYFSKRDYKCRMKESVIELVRKFGVPEGRNNEY